MTDPVDDDFGCVLSLIDGAPEAVESLARIRKRMEDLKLVLSACVPWVDEYEPEARAAEKLLGRCDLKPKGGVPGMEEALYEIADG